MLPQLSHKSGTFYKLCRSDFSYTKGCAFLKDSLMRRRKVVALFEIYWLGLSLRVREREGEEGEEEEDEE